MKRLFLTTSLLGLSLAAPALAVEKSAVLENYADIAQAGYEDSLVAAERLKDAIGQLVSKPSAENLQAARAAWLAARVPYQQTEVFRFGNEIVDEWEGKVNAWPLDEGMIDYVDASYGGPTDENEFAVLNVIGTPKFTMSGKEIDTTNITPALLADTLQEADGIEANVATGYHAIEFLLWGQDLNGHNAGAGSRPWTDYATGDACTNGNCDRRGEYLTAAAELLVSDLGWMAEQWGEGGDARASVLEGENTGLSAMLTGMGSLSYGELAGERMRLGLMLNDPEEEQDCFSDNTANSHYYDGLGVQNVYNGHYVRIDGTIVSGASLSDLVAEADPALDQEIKGKIADTVLALGLIKSTAEAGFAYDQMLERGNAAGEALVMGGVNGLIEQSRAFERAVAALGLDQVEFEGSDSLDDPEAVFQ